MVDFYRRQDDAALSSIPLKANKLLYILLSLLVLLGLRIWHLSVIQHEKRCEDAFKPRKKIVIEPSERGTIRDRFNILLAANKIEYRLAVIYSQIREVPAFAFQKDAQGVRTKRYLRKDYIKALAKVIAKEADLDEEHIADLIHSHAALYDSIPFILKHGLTEREYFRLKALEKDYPGLEVQRVPKRYYPRGKVGAHLIGYLGPMQKERYDKLICDIRTLSEYVKHRELGLDVEAPEGQKVTTFHEAKRKLFELQERAYTINDDIGVLGAEASFEEELRGYFGKRVYFSDAKGNFVRPMPGGHPSFTGKRLLLSISIELQEFAEKLLAQSELDRDVASLREKSMQKDPQKEPWMRGGAIVAMDPHTGDVFCMASYPRFNPNDFARQRDKKAEEDALRWIENEVYLAKVWDRSLPLVRELVKESSSEWYTEEKYLDWNSYLEFILPANSPVLQKLSDEKPILDLIVFQRAFDEILKRAPTLSAQDVMQFLGRASNEGDLSLFQGDIARYQEILAPWFQGLKDVKEKLLLLDLTRLVVSHEDFSPELARAIGSLSIEEFRTLSTVAVHAFDALRKEAKRIFHEHDFKAWKKRYEKEFLQAMRQNEKKKKLQARPYLDYLNKKEKVLFEAFWKKWRFSLLEFCCTGNVHEEISGDASILVPYYDYFAEHLLLAQEPLQKQLQALDVELVTPFLRSLKGFSDLTHPLYGKYGTKQGQTGKQLAQSFVKTASAGYLRSYAFRETTIQGSIFKLVTAYSGLKQLYLQKEGKCTAQDLRLFEIDDHLFKSEGKTYVGNFEDGKAIPQIYKGGRIPKSLNPHLGKMDLLRAIETSSNPYFSLIAGDYLKDPEDLALAARDFGYGEKTGVLLPGEIAGNIPNDLRENQTGLYATAIGQHTLVTTPLQTALMLSAIANGGKLLEPKIASLVAGKSHDFESYDLQKKKNFAYQKSLKTVGIDFPLFSQDTDSVKNEVKNIPSKVRREIFFPDVVRSTLVEGMRRSVKHAQEERHGALSRLYQAHPAMQRDFMKLKGEFVGKSSTAEVIEKVGLDVANPAHMYRHIWFGGFSLDPSLSAKKSHSFIFSTAEGAPELVVVVYLRYGGYGKEAAPIAAQVIQKWREIAKTKKLLDSGSSSQER